MKKQIIFYLIWDVSFFIYLFLFSDASYQMKIYAGKIMNPFAAIIPTYFLLILIGGFFAWLVYGSNRFPLTKKSSMAELLLVGIPAFYLSACYLPLSYMFTNPFEANIPWFYPYWLTRTSLPMSFGVILFGYELFIFAIRLVKIKKIISADLDSQSEHPTVPEE